MNWNDIQICQNQEYEYHIWNCKTKQFLHMDGTWQINVHKDEIYTGMYSSHKKAQEILDKYRPKIILSLLKPGQQFRFKHNPNVYRLVSFKYPSDCLPELKSNYWVERDGFLYNMSTDCEVEFVN